MSSSGERHDQKNTPAIWVVVVSWNTQQCLVDCLLRLRGQTYPALRTVVIDNGSVDGTVAEVRSRFPEVLLVSLEHNFGFARAANRGIQYALEQGADYILLLNPDTSFEPDLLTRLEAVMRSDARLGITTPKVYLERDRTRLWGIGGTIGPTGLRFVGMGEPDDGAYDAMPLDFVLGCAMFMRAQVPRQIGLMDDRFFVFYEEVDFCLRARSAGWEIGVSPEVHLRHFGGATTRDRPDLRTFHLARSRMIFLRKHFDRFEWLPLLLGEVNHFGRMLRWVLRGGHPTSVVGLLRGTVSGLIGRKIEFMRASGDFSRSPSYRH